MKINLNSENTVRSLPRIEYKQAARKIRRKFINKGYRGYKLEIEYTKAIDSHICDIQTLLK